MNFLVIRSIALRYLWLYTRHPIRVVELFFWPFVDLLVWGFLTSYLISAGQDDFPWPLTYLIGAMILWDVLFRSQQGVAISFLEDVWTRNLLNIFAAPVRTSEYLGAMFMVGFVRVVATSVVLISVAFVAYQFNLLALNWALIPFYANLMLFGWALGLVSMALIMRFGHGAEALAWAVPFMLQPICAVFYPVSALPVWLQPLALAFPGSHIFEGMRHALGGDGLHVPHMLWAAALNVVYLAGAMLLLGRTLRSARERGFLVKITSS
ncbi:MAG: ABC transporter permease [Akkermansiaceae bacterium]|nr:ABC transporter permease [Akkermansiaceae bacterium]